MARASVTTLDVTVSRSGGRSTGLVVSLLERVRSYRHQMAERNRIWMELERSSDRQLADLGIGRADIRSIAECCDLR
ncbi:hypothetical protein [Lichenicoccus sp.]|uniref:hypothetical protein n=1 Tax=Lichenicoccus sp. TaxID=2781899 RepID=UPI003D1147CB